MVQQVISTVGRVYSFLVSLVVALILVVCTWLVWGQYRDARIQQAFDTEGQLISLRVSQADHNQRSWQDMLSRSAYLTLSYRGKAYMTRYVMDSSYVSAGDRVSLLYHPDYDALRQPGPGSSLQFDQSTRQSRLIDWSTVRAFSKLNRLLGLCILLTIASFFLTCGVIQSILPIPYLSELARVVFVGALGLAAVFFTYDGWQYVRYYQHLKTAGQPIRVQVLDTDRIAQRRQSSRRHLISSTPWYDYQATIRYQQQERVIPISERDFETIKPPATLMAYYDPSVNDFMSIDYGPDYQNGLGALVFWILTFIFIRPFFVRQVNRGQP
ncbi:hypothetical protein GCM10028818_50340 [Spirosoma horti]